MSDIEIEVTEYGEMKKFSACLKSKPGQSAGVHKDRLTAIGSLISLLADDPGLCDIYGVYIEDRKI